MNCTVLSSLATMLLATSVLCGDSVGLLGEPVTTDGESESVAAESTTQPAAQSEAAGDEEEVSFETAALSIEDKLALSVEELNALRAEIDAEFLPLSRKLSRLENELMEAREEHQRKVRLLDSRALDLSNLRSEIKRRREESTYLSNLLDEYRRNLEAVLHIAEKQRYTNTLSVAEEALGNKNLSTREVYQAQVEMVSTSLDRLTEALGGTSFEGEAVDANGLVKEGTFVLVGPSAIFRSHDGQQTGTVEKLINSKQPTVIRFADEAMVDGAKEVVATLRGGFPLDPTLGNAHVIENTKESLWEHVQKGGPVMVPIFALAAAAMLVGLYKWASLACTRKPSSKRISELLGAVSRGENDKAVSIAGNIQGPVGRMLHVGAEHLDEPRELIEEVMYEKVLATRLRVNSFLPFVKIAASAAPLLGLLGTVTGIINTFKLMTVFGTGDAKTVSGGISEALITTKFGLIVAIPSLLLYALLSRKAKGIVDTMEKAAVAFINQVSKKPTLRVDNAA